MRRVDSDIWNRVEQVLGSGAQLALATTGGGCELVSWLIDHPGASQAVVEAQIPYHPAALRDYLGAPGPHRAEEKTAVQMAGRAFARCRELTAGERRRIGLGCTAALATGRERRGEDRACIALRSEGEYRILRLDFDKGAAGRLEEEELLSRVALEVLVASCCGADMEADLPDFARLSVRSVGVEDAPGLLYEGVVDAVGADVDGGFDLEIERQDRLFLPGSFNPFHEGHRCLAQAAAEACGRSAALEISIENVDKPPLARVEVERRLEQIDGEFPVVLTRAPTFVAKSRLFDRCTFAVGYDTALRLLQPVYYEGEAEGMEGALEEMEGNGCRFLVAGRLHEGRYRSLEELEIPERYCALFVDIPETAFRLDISSTQIRARTERGHA